ncbi:PTS fructose transporter subunit IIABC [Pseudoleptotrichia goodfellowii]|uniref:PTS system fructose subfamily transporter subunit IIC n=1 Tax=Pseudoleptotrichia goodfellowii TaxID=157692 RepID=A0A510JBA3_9FUSO|nr:fructose-specific PTS transporter subunit EIIC [Pseudoleptotrichia goodfellowii]BBM36454.1 PTS system fructose subfamily transporter subunit IIC [Pseudoleptotrichia goodfellowii]
MKISDLLIKERINLDLKSEDKESVIREIAKLHDNTGVLTDYEGYVGALNAREAQSSTALEEGIAIPHAKTEYVKEPALAMGRSSKGIDYDSIDGEKSTLFFMIAAPAGANNTHIETLARLTQLLLDDEFKTSLDNAKTPEEVLDIINAKEAEKLAAENAEKEAANAPIGNDETYIIAATACPTGIAHTYMAEEALKKAATEMGIKIKVETNGTDGRKNELTAEDIKAAKGVILAIDRNIEMARFDGKQLIKVGAKEGINNAKGLIQKVLDGNLPKYAASASEEGSASKSNEKSGLYKHLMSGVSYMLPLVISGGILIALAFLVDTLMGNTDAGKDFGSKAALAKMLMTIGGQAFGLFVPILGGYIAYSMGDRAALTAGLVAGALATSLGSGFLGAIVGGLFAGAVVKFLIKSLSGLPKSLNGLKMILFYPVLSVLIVGLAMIIVINPIVSIVNTALTNYLNSMNGSSAVLLGLILGGMMAVDMGGPVNKAAYVFGTGTLAATMTTGGSGVMAAVMAGGMVPPLAIALASTLFKNKFTEEEREAGLTNYVMGLSFITEGAIPYAAADPTRVIPANLVGAAISGALTMLFGIKIRAPHGGVLVMALSNNFIMYFVAIAVGSIISAVLLGLLKKDIKKA